MLFKVLLFVVGLSALFGASVLFYKLRRPAVTESEPRAISVEELLDNMSRYDYKENTLAVNRMLESCRVFVAISGKLMTQNNPLSPEEKDDLMLLLDDFNNHYRIVLELSKNNSTERSCARICRDIVNKIYVSLLDISR